MRDRDDIQGDIIAERVRITRWRREIERLQMIAMPEEARRQGRLDLAVNILRSEAIVDDLLTEWGAVREPTLEPTPRELA